MQVARVLTSWALPKPKIFSHKDQNYLCFGGFSQNGHTKSPARRRDGGYLPLADPAQIVRTSSRNAQPSSAEAPAGS